jgi:hypothetical protein
MIDLTSEEFDEMVEMAVDEAIERAFEGKVTAPGLMIFLNKYHVNNEKGRVAAFSMLKEMGVKVHSNEGFGGSGRLNTPNR